MLKADMLITQVDQFFLDKRQRAAKLSPRLRAHHNFHESSESPVQRLSIALQPDTYVRPHRHVEFHQWEMIILLTGEVQLLVFDDSGAVTSRILLSHKTRCVLVELPVGTWHSLFPVAGEATILEVKQGPYRAAKPEDVFAPWAPEEGSDAAQACLSWMQQAEVGQRFV